MNATKLQMCIPAVNEPVGTSADAISTSPKQLEQHVMNVQLNEHRIENNEMRMTMKKLQAKMEDILAEVKKSQSFNAVTGGAYGGGGGDSSAASAHKRNKDDKAIELEEKLLELHKNKRILEQKLEATQHSDDQLLSQYAMAIRKFGIDVMPTDHVEDILKSLIAKLEDTQLFDEQVLQKCEKHVRKFGIDLQSKDTFDNILQKLIEKMELLSVRENAEIMKMWNDLVAECTANKQLKSTITGERARHQSLVNQVAQLKSAKVSAVAKLSKSEDLNKSLQQQLSETSKQLERSVESGHADLEGKLKIIMNDLDNDLSDKCKQLNEPLRREILSLVAKCIKDATTKKV